MNNTDSRILYRLSLFESYMAGWLSFDHGKDANRARKESALMRQFFEDVEDIRKMMESRED